MPEFIFNMHQWRAEIALKNPLVSSKENDTSDFILLTRKNGLLNAMKFAQNKYSDLYVRLFEYISEYQNKFGLFSKNFEYKEDLIADLLSLDSAEIRVITRELVTFAGVLKLYAK